MTATLAHNLGVRRADVEEAKLVTSVGWIGNAVHQAECSDHNPDATGVVHAIDAMTLVLANQRVIVRWALAHPDDLEYVINQRTIWSRSRGFAPHVYTGSDPHTNHVHISGRHGTSGKDAATCTGYSRAAEKITPEGIPMPLTQKDADLVVATLVKDQNFQALIWRVHAMVNMTDTYQGGPVSVEGKPVVLTAQLKTTAATVTKLATP